MQARSTDRTGVVRRPGAMRNRPFFRSIAAAVLCVGATGVDAGAIYDAGSLEFGTTEQSMWGTGAATVLKNSVFVGTQWTDESGGVGGIIGEKSTVTINTNPVWWAWKACKETVDFLCGSQPSKGQIKETIDTRTGARVDLTTSGKFGLEFGYEINSGSVDASAAFSATAVVPGRVDQKQFVDLQTVSLLNEGEISTQSPWISAYMDGIAEFSGTIEGQACLILTGCTPKGKLNLPGVDTRLKIASIDPNSLKILPEALPVADPNDPNVPFAEVKLLNQTLTLEGALSAAVPPVPGFKLSTSQFTIASSVPPTPALTTELASLEFQVPEIQTTGGLENGQITSGGRDDVLKPKIDLDGVAAMGGFPPLGFGVDLIDAGGFKVSAQLDALDIDAGPDIGITQDFVLDPMLMVMLDFSHPVLIDGLLGEHTTWSGAWEALPEIAFLSTTTVNPTFWLDAMLTNTIGIDLGLSGTIDLLKFSFTASAGSVNILSTNPISLNSLLGLGNELFATEKLKLPIYSTPFMLGGFTPIVAGAFTVLVPAPGTLAILAIGLAAAGGAHRRRAQRATLAG